MAVSTALCWEAALTRVMYVVGSYAILWSIVTFARRVLPPGLTRGDVRDNTVAARWLLLEPLAPFRARHGPAACRPHVADGDSASIAPALRAYGDASQRRTVAGAPG